MEVGATKFQNAVGHYLQEAQSQPVIIEKKGRKAAVLLSFDEYEQLRRIAEEGMTEDQQRLARLGSEALALLQKFHGPAAAPATKAA